MAMKQQSEKIRHVRRINKNSLFGTSLLREGIPEFVGGQYVQWSNSSDVRMIRVHRYFMNSMQKDSTHLIDI